MTSHIGLEFFFASSNFGFSHAPFFTPISCNVYFFCSLYFFSAWFTVASGFSFLLAVLHILFSFLLFYRLDWTSSSTHSSAIICSLFFIPILISFCLFKILLLEISFLSIIWLKDVYLLILDSRSSFIFFRDSSSVLYHVLISYFFFSYFIISSLPILNHALIRLCSLMLISLAFSSIFMPLNFCYIPLLTRIWSIALFSLPGLL